MWISKEKYGMLINKLEEQESLVKAIDKCEKSYSKREKEHQEEITRLRAEINKYKPKIKYLYKITDSRSIAQTIEGYSYINHASYNGGEYLTIYGKTDEIVGVFSDVSSFTIEPMEDK